MRKITRTVLVLLALTSAAGALVAQELLPVGGGGDDTRLYPVSGNPDGTLKCAPKCGLLGPCC
ncbi:MAG TPA: hypothetical protein VFR81_19420 [Longimicrobium sp.]|nr:hypothetical protein [Longimicrobium sp.]